jgi:protein PhnA
MQLPHCPKCHSEYTYEDNGMFICPECAHEWNNAEPADDNDALVVKDANGNLLADGDSVTVKDLKVKGSSSMLKIGTKVKNIRLVEGDHNIDCKIDGFGPMKLNPNLLKRTDFIPRRPLSGGNIFSRGLPESLAAWLNSAIPSTLNGIFVT